MTAFSAQLTLFPDQRFGFIAFANTAGTSNFVEQVSSFWLTDGKLDIPANQRFDWVR